MIRQRIFAFATAGIILLFCQSKTYSQPKPMIYFPPTTSREWKQISPAELKWNEKELASLYTFLKQKHTKAFIILKNGKIAREQYFGDFTQNSKWYWASAGKTVTAFLIGIAQSEGLLDINDKTSKYLGQGWTSEPTEKEQLITIKNQLTMTTGLDERGSVINCTLPECLRYKADAGTRWAYHSAPYTILDQVIEKASGKSYNDYFKLKIKEKIGMNGAWVKTKTGNNVLFSDARSMARFGLLLLNKGKWADQSILDDANYFTAQISSSQTLNLSYGYLTWLNGKSSYMLPTTQRNFGGPLIPYAPKDMYAALGKNDQKIYVVPSQGLVIIRMGEKADGPTATRSKFDDELWERLNKIIRF